MLCMRPTITALLLAAVAAPAAAQTVSRFELDHLRAQQEALARESVARANELTALESRLRTEQALSDLRQQRDGPRVPSLRYEPSPSSGSAAAALPKFPTTPDAILADSNRRVREATKPRR